MSEELLHQVTLCLIPGIGRVTIRQLISYCGSAKQVFNSDFGKLSNIPGVGPNGARLILDCTQFEEAQKEIACASNNQIELLFYTHPNYPRRLKQLEDAPLLIYFKGKQPVPGNRTLGVVGTRKMTKYGDAVISELMAAWRTFNPTIISGLAYGVDIAAHRAALNEGLATIAVLGNSLDTIYPYMHKSTATQMQNHGGLISELKFGTKPDTFQFPKRNRIIAGLSDALVVVEAQASGGALITAKLARNYGRLVFAVPGPMNSLSSIGCLQLIKNNEAIMLSSAAEIVEHLAWSPTDTIPTIHLADFTAEEQVIIGVLKAEPTGLHIDKISWKAQIPINRTGSILLNLEFSGLVKCLPGKKFSLIRK